jgi:hypothetical protein
MDQGDAIAFLGNGKLNGFTDQLFTAGRTDRFNADTRIRADIFTQRFYQFNYFICFG